MVFNFTLIQFEDDEPNLNQGRGLAVGRNVGVLSPLITSLTMRSLMDGTMLSSGMV